MSLLRSFSHFFLVSNLIPLQAALLEKSQDPGLYIFTLYVEIHACEKWWPVASFPFSVFLNWVEINDGVSEHRLWSQGSKFYDHMLPLPLEIKEKNISSVPPPYPPLLGAITKILLLGSRAEDIHLLTYALFTKVIWGSQVWLPRLSTFGCVQVTRTQE